uniref:Proteasome assembly chaperone 1 n=1 Tax=Echinococcus canadensis TaxID=519352 RepID=A0A915F0P7_9CEST
MDSRFNSFCMKTANYIFAENKGTHDYKESLLHPSEIKDEDFILILKQDTAECFCLSQNISLYIKTFLQFNDLVVYAFEYEESCVKGGLSSTSIVDFITASRNYQPVCLFGTNTCKNILLDHGTLSKIIDVVPDIASIHLSTFRSSKGIQAFPTAIARGHTSYCPQAKTPKENMRFPKTYGMTKVFKFARDFVYYFSKLIVTLLLAEIYLKLQWAFSKIVDQIVSKSLALLEVTIIVPFTVITGTVKAQLKKKLSKFNYSDLEIRLKSEDKNEKLNDHVYLATLELSVFDVRDDSGNLKGSVSYADSLLISEIFLNNGNDCISTSVFNMTRYIPGFCCWDSEHSTKSSAAPEEKALPVALIHQGVNEVGIKFGKDLDELSMLSLSVKYTLPPYDDVIKYSVKWKHCSLIFFANLAFCQFNAGIIRIACYRLGCYWFAVHNVTCFSTDSKEFWGLWQIEVEDIFLERGVRPSPAPFCITSEDFTGLAKIIFGSNIPPCDAQCIFLVLRLGTASHDALEHLQACKVDLDVNKRPEVALVSGMGLEARIKVALNGVKGQFFYPPAADKALNSSRDISSVEMMAEESACARNHLESSLCLSAAQDHHGDLSIEVLLARCGIPFSRTDEQKLLLKQKLCIARQSLTCMSKADPTPSLDSLDGKGLENFSHDKKEQSNSLQMTIICGIHGSYVLNVAGYIVSMATESIIWLVLHPKSLAEVPDLLNSSLRQKTQQTESGETRRFRLLLVAPPWVSIPEILTQIESFLKPSGYDQKVVPFCITSTITCVDPRMCLMGSNGLMLPGLCPFFDRGWVNVIIFTNPTKMNNDVETSRARLLVEAIRQLNPQAVTLTAPFGKIRNCTQLALLLNDNLFGEVESQRYRLLTHCSFLGVYRLKAINVKFKLPLDRAKWISALKGLRSNLSPFSDGPIIVCVEANLAFDENPKSTVNCRYWPQTDVIKEAKDGFNAESGDSSPKGAALYSLTAHFFIIQREASMGSIYGGECEEKLTNWLKAWLRECLREAEKLKPLIEKEKLTKSELDKIQECFDQIVDECVAKENEKIKKFNATLLKTPHVDLFD